MIRIRRQLLATLAVVLSAGLLIAQPQDGTENPQPSQGVSQRPAKQREAYRKAMERADQKIADEVTAHSELIKNLEYLTTQIGPRLTGSPQMQAASQWTQKRFQDYGIDVHLETTQIDHGWTRGLETAEIVTPIQKRIGIHAFGWSKGTDGEVTGPVVALNISQAFRLRPLQGQAEGRNRHDPRAG